MKNIDLVKIQKAIDKLGFDAWLIYDFRKSNDIAHNILEIPVNTILTRRFYYLIPAEGSPIKIVNAIEAHNLSDLPGEERIYSTYQSLHKRISELALEFSKVAMEYSPVNNIPYVAKADAGTIELIQSFGIEVKSSGDLISMLGACWSGKQYEENIPVANALTDIVKMGFNHIRDSISAGEKITEYSVQQFMLSKITELGMLTEHPPLVAANGNAANPHYMPSEVINSGIKKGDKILFDIFARAGSDDAVWSDISWVGYVGKEVPKEFAETAQIVFDARDAAFDLIEERFENDKEIRGYEVDDAARKVITKAGYGEYFIHRTGHSITTEVHGCGAHMDNFESRDERLIIPATSFSIEPGIYIPGKFGIRSEIDVYINKDGKVLQTGGERQKEVVAILRN